MALPLNSTATILLSAILTLLQGSPAVLNPVPPLNSVTDQLLYQIYLQLSGGGFGAPVYPVNRVPFGDGVTAGGVTDDNFKYFPVDPFIPGRSLTIVGMLSQVNGSHRVYRKIGWQRLTGPQLESINTAPVVLTDFPAIANYFWNIQSCVIKINPVNGLAMARGFFIYSTSLTLSNPMLTNNASQAPDWQESYNIEVLGAIPGAQYKNNDTVSIQGVADSPGSTDTADVWTIANLIHL